MRSTAIENPTPATGRRDSSSNEMQLLDYLIILWKRRLFIAIFTFGVVVAAVIVVLLIANRYTASTIVLPPSQNSSMSSVLMGQIATSGALASLAGSSLGIKNPGDMYVSLFHVRTVEDAVIQRYDLQSRYHSKTLSQARSAFESHSTVVLGAKDGLIRITVTDVDPKESADIANDYVEEFRKLSAELATTEASQRRIFFQQQLLDSKQNLANAEEAMKRTEQTTGVLQIDSQARSLIESAANLRAQIVAKEVQLQTMHSYATSDNPEMEIAEQQLTALKAQLSKLAGTDQNSGADLVVPKGKVPEASMEYLRRLRDVKYYETISELIAKQFEVAKLDEARQGSVVQVVEPAITPDRKSSPYRALIVVAAAFLSFLLISFWIILRKMLSDLQNRPEIQNKLRALLDT